MPKKEKKIKVVIVGGGFGGVYTARYLDKIFKKDAIHITLINKKNYFLFTPLLHEVATGGLTHDSIVEPIREIFRNDNINFVEDTVLEIKTEAKEVITSKDKHSYDYLVVSPGADTTYFDIPGAREHCFSLKSLEDAIALRNHILETCEKAVVTKNKDLLTFTIIGAGPTGVELAGELIEYIEHTLCSYYKNSGFEKKDIKITLVTSTPNIISQFPEKMQKLAIEKLQEKNITVMLNAMVSKIEPDIVSFKDGGSIRAHTVIWVAGVTPTLSQIKGLTAGVRGRMETNDSLQYIKNPEIFSLGDSAGSSPMLAQVAVRQAGVVAENIFALCNGGELKKYIFKQKGLLISIGQWYALGHFDITEKKSITLSGPIMWFIWRTIYLFNFLSWRKRIEIVIEWTINLFYPRDITIIR